jgi:hypothetical protein
MIKFRPGKQLSLYFFPLLALTLLLLSACLPTDPEPALSDQVAGEAPQEVVTVARPTAATATATITPTPFAEQTAVPHAELTTTPWPPATPPTPTPAPPFPNMVYSSADGLWQIGADWQPQLLSDDPTAVLEPNGRRLLSVREGDVWLTDLNSGQTTNLTNTPGQTECCPKRWPGQPDTIFIGIEPGADGRFLAQLNLTTNEISLPGPSQNRKSNSLAAAPNGISFAFDLETEEAWVHMTNETTQFDPYAYGLPETLELRAIGAPAWSPDSQKLAWVMVLADTTAPDEPPAVVLGVFNLAQRQAQLLHPYSDILGRDGWFSPPVWSPDGQWLAYEVLSMDQATQGLWVLAANGSSEHYIGAQNPIWSADGRYLTYQNAQGTQMTYPPEFAYQIGINLPPDATLRDWQ